MKTISACSSGNWTYMHTGSKDFGHESIVAPGTLLHESLEGSKHADFTRRNRRRIVDAVRSQITAAHKTMHGLSSCEPVAGNWRTVY